MHLGWVELNRRLVVRHCVFDFLVDVVGVGAVVVDLSQVGVNLKNAAVRLDCLCVLRVVVIGVSESDKSLKMVLVNPESLLVANRRLLEVAGVKEKFPH